MTKTFLSLTFMCILNCCFAQQTTTLFFKDGTSKTGTYKMKSRNLIDMSSNLVFFNKKTNENYLIDTITDVVISRDTEKEYYEVIDVKKNFDDKKTEKKLGFLAYSSPKVNMYYIAETIHSGGAIGVFTMNYGYKETYIKKSKDAIAYNMGYIYGAGERGIKKRVRDYFYDCPKLVELVDNDNIDKHNTFQIVKYYEENCAE